MSKYYYQTKTTMLGDSNDPAKKIAREYTQGSIKIFYGDGEAIVMVEETKAPIVTELDVKHKEESQLKGIKDKKLIDSGFDADEFTKDDKEEK